jgi:UDP-GlcNAc:undecaprenyl-phosphate/decaprenyl-phosphate GlcNAc-1-phosphate transferase
MFSETMLVESVFAFFWALIMCSFAIPPIIYLSIRKRLLDEPGERRVHVDSTSRLGGLAIFASFISAISIFGDFSSPRFAMQQVLAGVILLFFVGVKDDIVPITAFKKFFVQLLSTGIVVFVGGLRVSTLHGFMGVYGLENIGMSYAFTFVMIIAIVNAINLIDGLNGLAGSLVFVISLVFGVFLYQVSSPLSVMCFATTGAMIGFLKFNMLDGKIFMGDSGSLVVGFLVAVFSVSYLQSDLTEYSKTPHLCIAILIVPLFDTLRVFITRLLQGRSPFSPDKNHIHHLLMRFGFSQANTVFILIGFNVFVILLVNFLPHLDLTYFVLGISAFAILVSLFFRLTEKEELV